MKIKDIPQVIKFPTNGVNVSWVEIENTLKHYEESSLGLELDPDFQRVHVWTENQQKRYVEYKLKGGYGADLILWNCASHGGNNWDLYESKDPMAKYHLVDGKQRLEAVRKFLRNELQVFGHTLSEFEDSYNLPDRELGRRKLGYNLDFIFAINILRTRKEMLQWYLDFNSGGTVHSEEEIEKVVRLLKEENKNDKF
jgi:Protein of unknown function DUF262